MNRKVQLKLCPYCDGQMDIEVIACPYCGNDVSELEQDHQEGRVEEDGSVRSLSPKETISSLYPPPYQPKVYDEHFEEELHHLPEEERGEENKSSALLPTLLLSLGVNLFAFAFLLFFFSTNGRLHLSFNGHLWFLYLLIAMPMIYFGFRKSKNI